MATVYSKLFEQQCFNPVRSWLPQQYTDLEPFEISQSLDKIFKTSAISREEMSSMHNKLIEELSKYEYGISTLHAKKLVDIGQPLSSKSVIEIIKNNPGRVSSSWELLIKYGSLSSTMSDELLASTLENIVLYSASTSDENSLTLADIAHCMFLLDNISDKKCVKAEIIDKLIVTSLDAEITSILPSLLSHGISSLEVFSQRIDHLTPFQIYQMNKCCPFASIKKSDELLYRAVNVLGENTIVSLTEKELSVTNELQGHFNKIAEQNFISWKIEDLQTEPASTSEEFLKLLENIQSDQLDRKELALAKKLLRILGVFKNNTKISLELYHSYLLSYPGHANELMFENFLALAYQSFRTSNQTLMSYAEVFIPTETSQLTFANICRVLILVNSKFNIEESLKIFNSNIETFSKQNDPHTNVSPSGLISEALILAYLARGELDFARVIFDGSAREKLLSGPTAIKRVKNYLTQYGEAIESGTVLDKMEQEVLKTLRNI